MLNFDKIPDSLNTKPTAGTYTLVIKESKITTSSKGTVMLQNNYATEDGKIKINYDNCPLEDASGNPCTFGLVKLKKLITATKVNVTGEIDPKILPPLLIGKKFKATCELTKDEKYLEIRNINSIVEADFEEEDIFKDIKTEDPWSI